jgi:methylmalonyl-CoA carboxyltransferase 5S subunit
MAKTVEITELVLRDAHQSLLATRLTLEDMIPACQDLDGAGYWSLECWGGATFDSCIRFLNEDPWERLRTLRRLLPNSRLQMLLRGQNLLGYHCYPDEVVERFVLKAAADGMDVFRIFDALNDPRNLQTSVAAVRKAGKHAQGAISYTVSPVHTIQSFIEYAWQLKELGCHSICIKDVAGLLKPQAAFELVQGIKQRCGKGMPVHLHAHATTGITLVAYMKALEAGADGLDSAISSLSMGAGHNPTESLAEMLESTPFRTNLDLGRIRQATRYFASLRPKYREFVSEYSAMDAQIVERQIPPSMIANIESQLSGQAASARMEEVLSEVPRVRADCGYPPLFTPISQIVGTQAVFNVLSGKYQVLTGEFSDLMLGYYGATPGEKNSEVLNLVTRRSKRPPITSRAAELSAVKWEHLRAGAAAVLHSAPTEEDVLTYAMFPYVAPKFFKTRAAGPRDFGKKTEAAARFAVQGVHAQSVSSMDSRGSVTYVITLNGKEHRVTVSRPE